MVIEHPPTEAPPVAFTAEYRDAESGPYAENAEIVDGRLLVRAPSAQFPAGVPAIDRTFRDVIVDTRLELLAGDDNTAYGVYVRQTANTSYIGWGMSASGRILVGAVIDNAWHTLADADLAPDLPFDRGLGVPNRFQVVAIGPALVFVLNGAVVTGLTVDARFKEGYLGYWLLRGSSAPADAVLAVDWIQVRAVLPDQPASGESPN